MSLFKDLTTDGLEEAEDRVGGGFSRPETDVYMMNIKVAYAGQSSGGARNVTVVGNLPSGEYNETIYITDKSGKNYFLSKDQKDDNGNPKRIPLPGFNVIDDICQVVTGKPLSEQLAEEKMVQQWNPETRKQEPKAAMVLTELTGKNVLLAIKKSLVNKNEKDGAGNYVPTAETREENSIEKVFHPELRITVVEAKRAAASGKEAVPEFIDVWLEKNKGKTHDKRQIKDGDTGVRSGRPGAANAGPPQGGQASAPRKSLFGGQAAA